MTIAAARSVLEQSMPDFELLVVDDGSNDGLLDQLIDLWRSDERVTLVRHARNSGLPAVRLNAVLRRAEADILGYQFEDDLFETHCLETLLSYRPAEPDFMVYGVSTVLTQDSTGEWVQSSLLGNSAFNFGRLYADNYIANNAVIHSKGLFELAGMYDPHILARRCCDYDLWVRFARIVVPKWCPEVVGSVRVRETNSLGSTVNLTRELYHFYRESNRSVALKPCNNDDYDVTDQSFASDTEMVLAYRNDILSQYFAQHFSDAPTGCYLDAAINGSPLRLAVAKPDFSTSVDVTIGNFATTFPNSVKFGFFNERHLSHLYDPQFYDVLVQYRTVTKASERMGALTREFGKALVYLMDDNMLRFAELGPEHAALAVGTPAHASIEAQIRAADLVIVYSQQLVQDAAALNPRVVELSTNIPAKYLGGDLRRGGGKVRFGLISGNVRLPEIRELWPQLVDFFRAHAERAELVIWGLEVSDLPSVDIVSEVVPFSHSYQEYLRRLKDAGLDYMLCPLRDETATKKSKSPVKLLEACAAGAMLIASDAVPYEVVKERGLGMLVPWAPGEWRRALERALGLDGDERAACVSRAKAAIAATFTTESQLFAFFTAFRSAMLLGKMRRLIGEGAFTIAYFFRETVLGGATLHLMQHARLMVGLGYSVILCVPDSEDEVSSDFTDLAEGITLRVERLRFKTSVDVSDGTKSVATDLAAFLKRERVGLVHGTPYSGDWILGVRIADVPIVLSLHQSYDPAIVDGVPRDAAPDAVHCSSRQYTRMWRKGFRVRCTTIPVPVPLSQFSEGPVNLSLQDGTVRILVSGTIQARKGQLNAVLALSLLIQEGRDLELILAGYDDISRDVVDYAMEVRAAIEQEGLAGRVRVTGFVRDIDRIYNETDILLCSSSDESMPHGILKAMARGIPVVTTPVGGVREIIRDGFSGIMVPSNAPDDLAGGIRRVLAMAPGVREGMVAAARATARYSAGEDVVLTNLLGIYLDAYQHLEEVMARAAREDGILRQANSFDVRVTGVEGSLVYVLGFDSDEPHRAELIDKPNNWDVGFHQRWGSYYRYNGHLPTNSLHFRVTGNRVSIRFLKSAKSDCAAVTVNGGCEVVMLSKTEGGGDELRLDLSTIAAKEQERLHAAIEEAQTELAKMVEVLAQREASIVDLQSAQTARAAKIELFEDTIAKKEALVVRLTEERATLDRRVTSLKEKLRIKKNGTVRDRSSSEAKKARRNSNKEHFPKWRESSHPGALSVKPAANSRADQTDHRSSNGDASKSAKPAAGEPLGTKRDWQNWDVGSVAEMIEETWQRSSDEAEHRERLSALVSPYVTDRTMTILEVGCGTGQVYKRLVPGIVPNSGYTGVDVSANMLAIARRNFPHGSFLLGDGYRLEFPDRSFDLVLCFEVLGHLPDIEPVIDELLRVARRKCIFTVWQSAGSEITSRDALVGGIRFLHSQHPDAYIRSVLHAKAPVWAERIQTAVISRDVVAYALGPGDEIRHRAVKRLSNTDGSVAS